MKVKREDAVQLWMILSNGKWKKQKDIPMKGTKVRAVCNEYAGHFVSNTSQGYKLARYATAEEIEHSINDLRSRSQKMLTRARALEGVLINRKQFTTGL